MLILQLFLCGTPILHVHTHTVKCISKLSSSNGMVESRVDEFSSMNGYLELQLQVTIMFTILLTPVVHGRCLFAPQLSKWIMFIEQQGLSLSCLYMSLLSERKHAVYVHVCLYVVALLSFYIAYSSYLGLQEGRLKSPFPFSPFLLCLPLQV